MGVYRIEERPSMLVSGASAWDRKSELFVLYYNVSCTFEKSFRIKDCNFN